jgi:hypothetical protein
MNSLRSGSLRVIRPESNLSPIEGLANLADLMLVLACGLMLSLVVSWNVDLNRNAALTGVEQGAEVRELEGLKEYAEGLSESYGYEELGVVYKDPATGKLYMVERSERREDRGENGSQND